MNFNIGLDLFPLLAAVLAGVSCGILGNFLVLRRLSLMGDAISHSVLPGLVVAFLITAARDPITMFLGAAIAGLATVLFVELVKRFGRVEGGAAMGVVFSIAFAAGVLLIERAAARQVDLDADCVLHGQLETLVWYGAPGSWAELLQWKTIQAIPRQVTSLLVICLMAILFVGVFYKELRIAAFDPALARIQGISAALMHTLLMVFVAAATVASFEAVGSILVVAMLICPAATARLLTDCLRSQILCSVAIAILASVAGYVAASVVPDAFNRDSVNAAGSIAVMCGIILCAAIVLSPTHGLLVRTFRQRSLARAVGVEDLIALTYRAIENGQQSLDLARCASELHGSALHRAVTAAQKRKLVVRRGNTIALTDEGLHAAQTIVRKHRLWERYLVDELGLRPDHVHDTAMVLEHVTEPQVHQALARKVAPDQNDPHGKVIPD